MAVATKFWNYSTLTAPDDVNHAAQVLKQSSPNLLAILDHLFRCYQGRDLSNGARPYARPVRGGTAPSAHTWSALDWRYMAAGAPDGFTYVITSYREAQVLMDWLVEHSAELGIQAIHDYWGDRIWRAWRSVANGGAGWKKQNGNGNGMGQRWASYLHIEVHPDAWFDGRPVEDRIGAQPDPDPDPEPEQPPVVVVPDPQPDPAPPIPPADRTCTVNLANIPYLTVGSSGPAVARVQTILNEKAGQGVTVDGQFGEQTKRAVTNWQAWFKLGVDGEVGPQTWGSLLSIWLTA